MYSLLELENEIQSIHQILNDSINLRYGTSLIGKKLSSDEHFLLWDKMWELIKIKKSIN